jgi:hypothetical protein
MSENGKLSFRKRISIVKATVINTLLESKELSKLGSGSSKNGYYSLSTIMETFQPALVDNDLDFEITMKDNQVTGIWYDCQGDSEKQCEVVFCLERLAKIIENLERLPQMQNAIQTEGSIKTYFRRYALTAFLNLPATDEIDTNLNGSQKNNQKTPDRKTESDKKLSKEEKSKQPYSPDLKKISDLAEKAGFSSDDLFKLIKALFNKSELLKLDSTEEIQLTEYLSIKAICKIANVSHEEFNKYLNDMFKKKNWFSLTAEEKTKTKDDLERMISKKDGETVG